MARVTFDHVRKEFGNVVVIPGLDLEIGDGEFLVLVGPSGCGKSTAMRMIAGLEEVTSGRVLIGDRVVNHLAPGDRNVAMVFQSYALYPHMTVYDNLAFGLRNVKMPADEIDRRVTEAARMLDLTPLMRRKPKQLSGGQRQRVALGRAIVRDPDVFLMDEPLSNLDAKLRVETRANILKLHRRLGTTFVYVTHDQVEAMTMGDRIAVMDRGEIQQVGTPEELYTDPVNVFVAGFIGSPSMNLLTLTPEPLDGRVVLTAGSLRIEPSAEVADAVRGRGSVVAGFRPEHLELGAAGAAAATLSATVEVVEYLGDEQLVHLAAGDTTLMAKLGVDQLRPRPGDALELAVPAGRFMLFDPETGRRVDAGRLAGVQ
jgi:multiple sugar transport system ATP-binding protein